MDFENYVRHMTKKYEIAVAIAVINNKPENLSIEQYISELRAAISENMESDDLEITINIDDFNYDESDFTFPNNDEITNNQHDSQETSASSAVVDMCMEFGQHDTTTIETDISRIPTHPRKNAQVSNLKKSLKTNKNTQNNNLLSATTTSPDNGIELINASYEQNVQNKHNTEITKDTIVKNKTETNKDSNKTYIDSQKTELYSVHGITQDFFGNKSKDKLNTAKSINKDKPKVSEEDLNKTYWDSQQTELYSVLGFSQENTHVSQTQGVNVVIAQKFLRTKDKNNKSTSTIPNDLLSQYKAIDCINNRNTEHSLVNVCYQNNTDINNDVAINQKYLTKGNLHNTGILNKDVLTSQIEFSKDSSILTNTERISKKKNELNNTSHEFSQYGQNIDKYLNISEGTYKNIEENKSNKTCNTTYIGIDNIMEIENKTNIVEEINNEVAISGNNSEDDLSSSQEDVISFKVIEELNKIKMYLNRRTDLRASCEGYSTDSGYKSNSQRNSIKSCIQMSDNWLNQSAHTLFDYIVYCPLATPTQQICKEISQVLGNFIDRLHEDENYPSFLELLLEYIDSSLRYIHEEENNEDDLLLKKDGRIHRLLLLNKSLHIIKYTIEKLTLILENVHCNLKNKEDLYEITNIRESENVCYLFNILEVLLKRYTKRKSLLSQTSIQASPDDGKFPRKSSITDIWRKKWNPNYKEKEIVAGSCEKKCIIEKCGEVLNKIIIQCMDGYSLVSFAALQCFNLLQS